MTQSLNEIEALCKRAARGAGRSWGVSEEAGRAVRWLASHELPSGELLVSILQETQTKSHSEISPVSLSGFPWRAEEGALCPLVTGAALNDCADMLQGGKVIDIQKVSHPLLIVPFAAWAAYHTGGHVAVTWNGARAVTDGINLVCSGPVETLQRTSGVDVQCQLFTGAHTPLGVPKMRGSVGLAAWEDLNSLAARTYAPATEASRQLGAGSGVSDND